MKVGIFSSVDLGAMGGLEVMMRAIYPAYRENNIECSFFLPFSNIKVKNNYAFPIKLMPPGAMSLGLKSSFYRNTVFKTFLKFYVKNKFDILHIHCTYPLGVILSQFMEWLAVPAILHCHAVDIQTCDEINYGARQDSAVDKIIRKTINSFSSYIAANSNIANIITEMGVSADNINLIYNGTHLSNYRQEINKNKLRSRFNISENDLFLISAGRNHPVKGYELAIKSLANHKNIANWKYVIFGKEVSSLQPLVIEKGLESKVYLDEEIKGTELCKYMCCADFYLLPSLIEGFPLVKAEAFAAGLPVITTNTPGCIDCVTDGVNGLIAKTRNENDYRDKLQLIFTDHELVTKLKSGVRETSEQFDWKVIVYKFLTIYKKFGAVN